MGREIKRVPLDFTHPTGKVWPGYLMPDRLADEEACPACDNGYSTQAQHLHDLWYGNLPFDPASTGSRPFTPDTPAVRKLAERNVTRAPAYYGTGDHSTRREAQRLANLFNGQWCHHLHQDDVNALVAEDRLRHFTHTRTKDGWQPIDPPVVPTAAQVNEWSLVGFGHDSLNAHIVIKARCDREGVPDTCGTCGGHGSLEAYEGQRAEAEAWTRTEPPTGDGWQLWETDSEGSPVSPVCATADDLAGWMSDPERGDRWVPAAVAAKFIADGWAPSLVDSGGDVASGVEFAGMRDDT